jgi:predicted RNase H-like nuclease (RuvC/YqgF family)
MKMTNKMTPEMIEDMQTKNAELRRKYEELKSKNAELRSKIEQLLNSNDSGKINIK